MIEGDFIPTLSIYVLITCLLSAFFSLAEASIVGLSEYRIRAHCENNGGAERLKKLFESKKDNLSTALFLNTTVNIAGVAAIGAQASKVLVGVDYKIFVFALTMVLLVMSEVKPKVYASTHPEKVAAKIAAPMLALTWLCRPFVAFIHIFLKKDDSQGGSVSAVEMRSVLMAASESGVIDKSELQITQNVFNLGSIKAGELVLRESKITQLDVFAKLGEAVDLALRDDHKRIVAVSATGAPVGLFLQRDILKEWCSKGDRNSPIAELLYPVKLVGSDCNLAELARELYKAPNHFAIVMDSDGTVAGVVTLSNIQELLLT